MEVKQSAIANNKLLLLYTLREAGMRLSDTRLIALCGELGLMDYFDLSTSLAELSENGLVERTQSINGIFYALSEMGENTLGFFEKELRKSQRQKIADYCRAHAEDFRMEAQLFGEYIRIAEGQFRVTLKILENDVPVFEISLLAPSQAEADRLVRGWRKNAAAVYRRVFETLLT